MGLPRLLWTVQGGSLARRLCGRGLGAPGRYVSSGVGRVCGGGCGDDVIVIRRAIHKARP